MPSARRLTLGGFGTDSGNSIAVDPVAGAFVAIVGTSNSFGAGSNNFPDLHNYRQPEPGNISQPCVRDPGQHLDRRT